MSRSRQSAANFTAGNAAKQYPHYTVPKSRSENFVDYMRSTGYELPRNFSPAHCDFLFQDPELFEFAKVLMSKFKRAVGDEELNRFQTLLDSNQVLTKSELMLAESREKDAILHVQNSKKSVADEINLLTAEINQARRRIQQWNDVTSLHRRSQELLKTEKLIERGQNKNQKGKIQCLSHDLQQKRDLVIGDLRSTREMLSQALTSVQPSIKSEPQMNRQNWLSCTFDCVSIINEDSFFALLRSTAENYGTGLVGKSQAFDPFEIEEYARECSANIKDIERLRALILHEFERGVRLNAGLVKYRSLNESMDTLVETANRIASQSPQIQTRILTDHQKRFQELKIKTKALKNSKLLELCEGKLSELNGQLKIVQDSKATAKAKENQFFGLVSKMLLNQRARLEIVMRLMKRRHFKISEAMDSMTQFYEDIHQFSQHDSCSNSSYIEERLIELNPGLNAVLTKNNIPSHVMCSFDATWKAIILMDQNREIELIQNTVSDEHKLESEHERRRESTQAATAKWKSMKSRFGDTENQEGTGIPIYILIKHNQEIKAQLNTSLETRERIIKDAIVWKCSKSEDIKAFLESVPEFQ